MNQEYKDVAKDTNSPRVIEAVQSQYMLLQGVVDRTIESRIFQENDGLDKVILGT